MVRSASRSSFLLEHDLFGKPDSTFPDHALNAHRRPFCWLDIRTNEGLHPAATSGNTSSNAATNGQSLHTRRRWFAAKNPSWRSRTRSWTPRGTPPKEAAAQRAMHKKTQTRAALSHRAKALAQWDLSCGIGSWRRRIDPGGRQEVNCRSDVRASMPAYLRS